ncbi:MAG: hypothetical protein BM556_12905 [Bacteriovorax sp. MedPE-SWde]|nr:MAG: hypothetical protein BM556_12905 [Bacteriovorax sp. MedPE-SWde]
MKMLLIALTMLSASASVQVDTITTSEFSEFLELGDVIFEQAYLERGDVQIGKVVQATNLGNVDLCVISKLSQQRNVKNEFLYSGRMIIPAGLTLPLGGFTQINPRKSWYTKWQHAVSKNLRRCK